MKKNDEKREKLINDFESIQNEHRDNIDVSKYLAKTEDIPSFGDIEIYDYEKDSEDVNKQAVDYIEDLVNLYLGDNEKILNHPYIKRKKQEDAMVYSDSLFLNKMSRKLFIQQLKNLDNDSSARLIEVINGTQKEIRENIKDSRSARTEIERFYKDIRDDFGLNSIDAAMSSKSDTTEGEGKIIDAKLLNNTIDEILRTRNLNKKTIE